MLYQPKYCCNCSEKIERTNWRLWSSRRFCQLCEIDFSLQEWAPRVIVVVGLIFGIVGFFDYFLSAEKPVKIASLRSVQQTNEIKKNNVSQSANEKSAINSESRAPLQNSANTVEPAQHQNASSAKQVTPSKASKNLSEVAETIYFCGAETKKGTPCSRRIKNGGRCWQHAGQHAVLPPEKLVANR